MTTTGKNSPSDGFASNTTEKPTDKQHSSTVLMDTNQPKPAGEQIPSAKIAPTPPLITELPTATCPTCGAKSSNVITHEEMDAIEQRHPPNPTTGMELLTEIQELVNAYHEIPRPAVAVLEDIDAALDKANVRETELICERDYFKARLAEARERIKVLESGTGLNAVIETNKQLREQLAEHIKAANEVTDENIELENQLAAACKVSQDSQRALWEATKQLATERALVGKETV